MGCGEEWGSWRMVAWGDEWCKARQGADALHATQPCEYSKYSNELRVACGSAEEALILRNTLAVDPELQPDKLMRVISVHNIHLSVSFSCPDARLLRAAFNAFMDSLILAACTIEAFGPPPPSQQPCLQ
ncbi:unnamed protein product [Closterium sp. Yama58-4]|nr:unnamed protein product [Closterium sp. Yama58-4]